MPKPKGIVCSICRGEFFKASYDIHVKKCSELFEARHTECDKCGRKINNVDWSVHKADCNPSPTSRARVKKLREIQAAAAAKRAQAAQEVAQVQQQLKQNVAQQQQAQMQYTAQPVIETAVNTKEFNGSKACQECEQQAMALYCRECEQGLCSACSDSLHNKGARAKHTRIEVPATAPLDFGVSPANAHLHLTSETPLEYSQDEGDDDENDPGRVPCTTCGRRFATDRVYVHERICKKLKNKAEKKPIKIKQGTTLRVKNTEFAQFAGKKRPVTPPEIVEWRKHGKRWRQERMAFRSLIETQAELNGIKLPREGEVFASIHESDEFEADEKMPEAAAAPVSMPARQSPAPMVPSARSTKSVRSEYAAQDTKQPEKTKEATPRVQAQTPVQRQQQQQAAPVQGERKVQNSARRVAGGEGEASAPVSTSRSTPSIASTQSSANRSERDSSAAKRAAPSAAVPINARTPSAGSAQSAAASKSTTSLPSKTSAAPLTKTTSTNSHVSNASSSASKGQLSRERAPIEEKTTMRRVASREQALAKLEAQSGGNGAGVTRAEQLEMARERALQRKKEAAAPVSASAKAAALASGKSVAQAGGRAAAAAMGIRSNYTDRAAAKVRGKEAEKALHEQQQPQRKPAVPRALRNSTSDLSRTSSKSIGASSPYTQPQPPKQQQTQPHPQPPQPTQPVQSVHARVQQQQPPVQQTVSAPYSAFDPSATSPAAAPIVRSRPESQTVQQPVQQAPRLTASASSISQTIPFEPEAPRAAAVQSFVPQPAYSTEGGAEPAHTSSVDLNKRVSSMQDYVEREKLRRAQRQGGAASSTEGVAASKRQSAQSPATVPQAKQQQQQQPLQNATSGVEGADKARAGGEAIFIPAGADAKSLAPMPELSKAPVPHKDRKTAAELNTPGVGKVPVDRMLKATMVNGKVERVLQLNKPKEENDAMAKAARIREARLTAMQGREHASADE